MIRYFIIFILALLSTTAFATHNRGGEITYKHRPDLGTNTYEITITTCTKSTAPADRPELFVTWDDGSAPDTVPRVSDTQFPNEDAQKNIYIVIHTFSGAGTFRISVEDPNRNSDIKNIGGINNSDTQPFCIVSELVISPFLGPNNSVVFQDCPCPEKACVNSGYCYNPQATDPDGDSLSYQLVVPLGINCQPMPYPVVYQFPGDLAGVSFLDPVSGTFCWDAPALAGEYNIAIQVTEWRNGVKIGSVVRDIQITVLGNCNNEQPEITVIDDTCVPAGQLLTFPVTATDLDGDVVTLTSTGTPYLVNNAAVFPLVSGTGSVTGNFNWGTTCDHVAAAPYKVFFVAEDNATPVKLSSFATTDVTVKAPPVNLLSATPQGNTISIDWNVSECANTNGYRIYRKSDSSLVNYSCCSDDTPISLGFELIGSTSSISDTAFRDSSGLAIGNNYCYIVVPIIGNGIEGCLSNQHCATLLKDVPVITHVTIHETNFTTGSDTVRWSKPTELDTLIQFPPPYYYEIYGDNRFTNATSLLFTSSTFNSIALEDSSFIHTGINTVDGPWSYKLLLYNIDGVDTNLIGGTNNASSVFLSVNPDDNRVDLSWEEEVPWSNSLYKIYRGSSVGSVFTLIDSTTNQIYTDTGLINGATYCYKIEAVGMYSAPTITNPLINWSQEICAMPIDLTPPCPPVLTLHNLCTDSINDLTWTNPNDSCADDVTRYRVYYKAVLSDTFEFLTEINGPTNNSLFHNNNGSLAGCYYVTALDSVQYNNESDSSNWVCIDNCPAFELPNVFTPDSDQKNDFFVPVPPTVAIDSIDFYIYNRWGELVFQTNELPLKWDGRHRENDKLVSAGVYYYAASVFTKRLTGDEVLELNGPIHVFAPREPGP